VNFTYTELKNVKELYENNIVKQYFKINILIDKWGWRIFFGAKFVLYICVYIIIKENTEQTRISLSISYAYTFSNSHLKDILYIMI